VAAVHVQLVAVHHGKNLLLQYLVTYFVARLEIYTMVAALNLAGLSGAALSQLVNRFPVAGYEV
jgi:hypothetical protein